MPRQYAGSKLVRKTRRNSKTGAIEQSKVFYVRYKHPSTGKFVYTSTGTSDPVEAEEERHEIIRRAQSTERGARVPPSEYSVAAVLDDYARYMMGQPSAERLSYTMTHLLEFWGERKLDAVNKESIRLYCTQAERADGTLKRELTDLRSAINHAIAMDRVEAFKFPEIPVKGRKRERYLNRDEVAALLRAARHDFRSRFSLTLFIVIAYYSGARKRAILDLTWNRIDFANNTLDFRDQDAKENNKRRAKIPMPPILRSFLLRRHVEFGEQSTFVFHQKHDPARRIKHIDKGFRAAVKRAGLSDVTPHTLRHTRVSEFAQSGEEPINVAAYMAMSLQTIFEVYAHVNNQHVNEMAQRIGRSPKVRTKNGSSRNKREKE